jgi:acyl carrier protein
MHEGTVVAIIKALNQYSGRQVEGMMETECSIAETEQRFVDAIMSVVGSRVSRESITSQTRLIDDLSMRSIELLKLMLACEREIGISPADDDDLAHTLSTVGSAVEALHGLRMLKARVAG